MKLVCPYFNTQIDVNEGELFSLVIENQVLFRTIIEDLHRQAEGDAGGFVLSKDSVPISFCKYVDIIEDFAPFDINRKSLLTKIATEMERNALDGEHYLQTVQLLANVEKYMSEISFDFPFDVECSKLGISSLIKAATVRVVLDYQNPVEAIIAYMTAILDFDKTKLFITVNMRSYFNDEEIKIFFEEIRRRQIQVLMIDGYDHNTISGVKSLIIDSDLCEI